jgi:polyisoprenoid-binding protein YceI
MLAGFSLVLGACASPAAAPVQATPTSGAISPPPSSAADAASARPAAESQTTAASASQRVPTRVAFAAEASEARFRAREQLVGRSLPNEAVGSTRDVAGAIVVDVGGSVIPEQSKIVVGLDSLRSDESRRDNYVKSNVLQTQQFPRAELVARELRGAPTALPAAGELAFQIVGDLTVRGVTRPTVWDVTARVAGSEVSGLATTRVNMTDFGMTPPRVGPVLSIEDGLTLDLEFRAQAGSEPGGA